ncbi:MAG: hypothetical protein V1900_00110 [Candidatus Aenigmatarchaeota archaeon]
MKGLEMQTVFWIFVMIVVLTVIIIFLTKPTPVGIDEHSFTTEGVENAKASCEKTGNDYVYTIKVSNLNFVYEQEKELKFYVIGDINEKLMWDGKVINYPKEKSASPELKLRTRTALKDTEFLHLSFFAESECVTDYMKSSKQSKQWSWYCCNAGKTGTCYIQETDKTITINKAETRIDFTKADCEPLGGIKNNYECFGTPLQQCQPLWEDGKYQRQFGNCVTKCRDLGGDTVRFETQVSSGSELSLEGSGVYSELIKKCPAYYIGFASIGFKTECAASVAEKNALFIKIDPADSVEVWNFDFTTDRKQDAGEFKFALDDFKYKDGASCAILAVNEESIIKDKASVWYIKPGAVIKKNSEKLWDDIKSYMIDFNCQELLTSQGECDFCITSDKGHDYCIEYEKSGPDPSKKDETIGGAKYTDKSVDKCGDCRLLERNDKGHYWKPKYDLLCSSSGWIACDEISENDIITVDNKDYMCKGSEWK